MQNRLRDIRKARGLTLADVAARCSPPTTAVTIGRLETGTRQLTLVWLERLARALEVDPQQILPVPPESRLPVAARITSEGAEALTAPLAIDAPVPFAGAVGLLVQDSQGDYRTGDELWLEQLPPERFAEAINRDILVPRPVGRFLFGRLIATEGTRLQLMPVRPGGRQTVVADPPWIARVRLVLRRV